MPLRSRSFGHDGRYTTCSPRTRSGPLLATTQVAMNVHPRVRHTAPHRSRRSGYSFVELVITVGMILVITTWAMPSFLNYYRSARVRAGAQVISAYLNEARQLAIKTNSAVCVFRSTASVIQYRTATGTTCNATPIAVAGLANTTSSIQLPDNVPLGTAPGADSARGWTFRARDRSAPRNPPRFPRRADPRDAQCHVQPLRPDPRLWTRPGVLGHSEPRGSPGLGDGRISGLGGSSRGPSRRGDPDYLHRRPVKDFASHPSVAQDQRAAVLPLALFSLLVLS